MGEVYVDSIGDRIADYSLLDMQDLEAGTFNVSHPSLHKTLSWSHADLIWYVLC